MIITNKTKCPVETELMELLQVEKIIKISAGLKRALKTYLQPGFFARLFSSIFSILLVFSLFASPAIAQDNSVDYTLTNQAGADFSGKDLSGTSFAAADVRDANFAGADMSGTILTKATFIRANLSNTDFNPPQNARFGACGEINAASLLVFAAGNSPVRARAELWV